MEFVQVGRGSARLHLFQLGWVKPLYRKSNYFLSELPQTYFLHRDGALTRVVADNRAADVKDLFDIMGKDYWPYAVNKPHHLSPHWAREWFGDNKGK